MAPSGFYGRGHSAGPDWRNAKAVDCGRCASHCERRSLSKREKSEEVQGCRCAGGIGNERARNCFRSVFSGLRRLEGFRGLTVSGSATRLPHLRDSINLDFGESLSLGSNVSKTAFGFECLGGLSNGGIIESSPERAFGPSSLHIVCSCSRVGPLLLIRSSDGRIHKIGPVCTASCR